MLHVTVGDIAIMVCDNGDGDEFAKDDVGHFDQIFMSP